MKYIAMHCTLRYNVTMKHYASFILGFMVLALSACGKQVIDPTFIPYVERFEQAAHENGREGFKVGSSIVLVEELAGKRAECKHGMHNRVEVRSGYWAFANDAERQALITHELGHCELGLEHDAGGVMAADNPAYGWSYQDLFRE